MIGRMFQRRGNQLVEVTNPSVILADTSNLVQGNTAPVYVNADTGDDVNDGMTANTAVKTINKALELAANRGSSIPTIDAVRIVIASGEYSSQSPIAVYSRVYFETSGTVVINAHLYSLNNGTLWLSGSGNYVINGVLYAFNNGAIITNATSVTVNGSIQTITSGSITLDGPTQVNFVNIAEFSKALLYAGGASVIRVNSTLSLSSTIRCYSQIESEFSSCIIFASTARVSINGISDFCIICGHCASFYLDAGSETDIQGTYSDAVLHCGVSSSAWIAPTAVLTGNPTGVRFLVNTNAVINASSAGINRIPGSQLGVADAATYGVYV